MKKSLFFGIMALFAVLLCFGVAYTPPNDFSQAPSALVEVVDQAQTPVEDVSIALVSAVEILLFTPVFYVDTVLDMVIEIPANAAIFNYAKPTMLGNRLNSESRCNSSNTCGLLQFCAVPIMHTNSNKQSNYFGASSGGLPYWC